MNLFLALFGGSVLFFLIVVPLLNRRQQARNAESMRLLGEQAEALGLKQQGVNAVSGELLFAGQSEGVAWTALVNGPLPGVVSRSRSKAQSTRLTFPSLTTAPGTFVLAMTLPPGTSLPATPEPSGGGLLASLAERAMEGMLDLYVSAYFGTEHRALVNVAGAARPQGPADFMVLSTDPAVASRLLDEKGQALLTALRTLDLRDGLTLASGGLGVLITPTGLMVGCQVGLVDLQKLKFVAERSAQLVAHARPG